MSAPRRASSPSTASTSKCCRSRPACRPTRRSPPARSTGRAAASNSTVVAWANRPALQGLLDVRQGRRFLRHPRAQGSQHQFAQGPQGQEDRRAAGHRAGAGPQPGAAGSGPAARLRHAGQCQLRQHGPDADLRRGRGDGRARAVPDAHRGEDGRQGRDAAAPRQARAGRRAVPDHRQVGGGQPDQDRRRRRGALGVAAVGAAEPEGGRRDRGRVPQGRAAHRRGLVQGADLRPADRRLHVASRCRPRPTTSPRRS